MTTDSSPSNRWWENYLVRYFLPALAGMLIVLWLQSNSGASAYIPKFLPNDSRDFGTAHLVLWLLLGSLYCYIASYPALVFHATRVLDFRDGFGRIASWPYWILNPYAWSITFAALAAVCVCYNTQAGAIASVGLLAAVQIARILICSSIFGPFGLKEDVKGKYGASIAYAYLRVLSERRATTTRQRRDPDRPNTTITKDEKDLVDSYRHLREHGNTALIVLLELSLCPILYLTLEDQNGPFHKVVFASVIVIWVLPSALIHFLAQHLERRFSWFAFSPSNTGEDDQPQPPITTRVTRRLVRRRASGGSVKE